MRYHDPYRFETWAGAATLRAPGPAGGRVDSGQLVRADGVVPELWGVTFSASRGVDGLGGIVVVRFLALSGAGNALVPVYAPPIPLSEGDQISLPWLAPSQHWTVTANAIFPPAFVGAIVEVACGVAPLVRPSPTDYAAMPYRGA